MRRFIASSTMLVALTSVAGAQAPGITFGTAPGSFMPSLDGTRGWSFSASTEIFVTALGIWDQDGDGFAAGHAVGLWDSQSTLLGSTSFAAGLTGTLGADGFRYLTLDSPFTLLPGTYRIGAHYMADSEDLIAQDVMATGADGVITYLGAQLDRGGSLADPTEASAVPGGAFGPNFLFTTSMTTVPEPSTWMLLGSGLLMLGGIARLRRGEG